MGTNIPDGLTNHRSFYILLHFLWLVSQSNAWEEYPFHVLIIHPHQQKNPNKLQYNWLRVPAMPCGGISFFTFNKTKIKSIQRFDFLTQRRVSSGCYNLKWKKKKMHRQKSMCTYILFWQFESSFSSRGP